MIMCLAEDHAQALAGKGELTAFVCDLAALRDHAAEVKAALSAPSAVVIFHAAKANPDAPILRALALYVDGIEVASGGELAHVREHCPTRGWRSVARQDRRRTVPSPRPRRRAHPRRKPV